MIVALLILVVFAVAAALMFYRKLPALLALPLMAVGITLIEIGAGQLGLPDLLTGVMGDGALRLHEAMVVSLFGGMLSFIMQKSGVAESFIKRGAELAGDNPMAVGALALALIALLFTTLGGLGAVIMVATVVLPILASVGMPPVASGGIFLFGLSLGGLLNAGNWVFYTTILGLPISTIRPYVLLLVGLTTVVALAFILVELYRSRIVAGRQISRYAIYGVVAAALLLGLFYGGGALLGEGAVAAGLSAVATGLRWIFAALLAIVLLLVGRDWIGQLREGDDAATVVRPYAYLIPLVPLVLILLYDVPPVAAFTGGLVYAFLTTLRPGSKNMLLRSMIEGASSVMPAILLMIGIGMLLNAILGPTRTGPGKYWYDTTAVTAPASTTAKPALAPADGRTGVSTTVTPAPVAARVWPVTQTMGPLLGAIVPRSPLLYLLLFSLLAPLALYRGPLNIWGLGSGVGGVLLSTGLLPAAAIMGVLMSAGHIQGISDPTNTANVWLANELRVDVQTLMWRTIGYTWLLAALSLAAATLLYF